MQYYVCNGQIPTETQDEGYTAFIEYMDSGAAGDKFDGFELVARLHMPESGRVCVICKATDAKAAHFRCRFGLQPFRHANSRGPIPHPFHQIGHWHGNQAGKPTGHIQGLADH